MDKSAATPQRLYGTPAYSSATPVAELIQDCAVAQATKSRTKVHNSVRRQKFCVYSPGTTLAYLITSLGLDQRMMFVDRNRTYRRNPVFFDFRNPWAK